MTQLDLFRAGARLTDHERSTVMLATLRACGRWMTRADLEDHGFTGRQCRAARQLSKGQIIMGQQGYKAASCATHDELWACRNALKSQVDAMLAEVAQLDTIIHGRPGE